MAEKILTSISQNIFPIQKIFVYFWFSNEIYQKKIFGYRWVPGTGQEKIYGYRWVPGTGWEKNFGYRWVPGTGSKKNFGYRWVPGTKKIFTYADPWLYN